MTEKSKVAVIIVNWNGEKYLEKCLQAVLSQTLTPSNIIVVDNASTDSSEIIIRNFSPTVTLVQSKVNIGFAAGNNLGVEYAGSVEWLALLNPDAFPEPTWLEELVIAANRFPQYSYFGSKLVTFRDSSILDGTGDVYHCSGMVWRQNHGVRDIFSSASDEIFSPCAAAAMYSLDAFKEAGGFDEDFFCYLEDVDLGFRLRLLGYRCLYVPMSVVHHVGSASTVRHSDFYIFHGHRNLVWTYIKNMPTSLFWRYLLQHILLNLTTLVWFSFHGRFFIIVKAKIHAVIGIFWAIKKRRFIQTTKKISDKELDLSLSKGLFTPYFSRYGERRGSHNKN